MLIGVYERETGVPVIGVIAQPFGTKLEERIYSSSMFWGVCLSTLQAHNCQYDAIDRNRKISILSSSEDPKILDKLVTLKYELAFSAGAGHKALKVITNEADAYILSKGSTFRWDTCAPQAILRSLDGDILDYAASIEHQKAIPINYLPPKDDQEPASDWKRNVTGLIAVRNLNNLNDLLSTLKA